jgi:hypothetical protein
MGWERGVEEVEQAGARGPGCRALVQCPPPVLATFRERHQDESLGFVLGLLEVPARDKGLVVLENA